MASHQDATLFFSLPLELREQIYKDVLASPVQGPELLRACREIKIEAHKFLYQRPLNFRSQISLHEWLRRTPHDLLPQVTEISLEIQDVDLRPLLEPDASTVQTTGPPRLLSWELYEAELDRLNQALQKLLKVKTFTIRALSSRQSFLYREFLGKVLEMLSSLYPTLLDLRLEGNMHHQSLEFLTGLKHLRSLSFDGFSSTPSTETADILASLGHLSNLSLISQHEMLTPDTHLHSGFTAKSQSFTGDVIRTISQLASFSVIERIPTSSPTLFLTSEVLTSLHSHKALNSLSIALSHTPDDETLQSLQDFIKRSVIQRLELDWPDLEPGVLEEYSLIQEDLKTLWFRANSASKASEILLFALENRKDGNLQGLRKIVLVRTSRNYKAGDISFSDRKDSGVQGVQDNRSDVEPTAEAREEDYIVGTKRQLQSLGIQTMWCTEHD
ncbi:Nn.00g090240.m01.CDS01 [Neocucurbitaria sp. VM-36]